jgi:hypothetical protein
MCLFWFYSASSLKQQSAVDMLLRSDTLSWSRANQYFLSLLYIACLAEKKADTTIKDDIGFTRPIHCIRGEHANNYTTDGVNIHIYNNEFYKCI